MEKAKVKGKKRSLDQPSFRGYGEVQKISNPCGLWRFRLSQETNKRPNNKA